MTDEGMPRSLATRFNDCIAHHAEEMALAVQTLIREVGSERLLSAEGGQFLAMALHDEVTQAVKMGAVVAITDPKVRDRLATSKHRLAGKKSGQMRAQRGHKDRFLQWALELNKEKPALSKNAVAYRYAAENPGTSVATLRRYLAAIPIEPMD